MEATTRIDPLALKCLQNDLARSYSQRHQFPRAKPIDEKLLREMRQSGVHVAQLLRIFHVSFRRYKQVVNQ